MKNVNGMIQKQTEKRHAHKHGKRKDKIMKFVT
jgi:hypothetical protein